MKTKETNRYGAPGDGLLRDALEDEFRRRHGLNVLFADEEKRPAVRTWTEWQTRQQTDEDVRRLFGEAGGRASCWGYVTGVGSLWAIDFDVPWIYGLWRRRFGARAETLTTETPNIGGRPYFLCEEPVTSNRFKETLHVELEGPGRFAIKAGAIRRADGSMGEYRVAVQKPILRDDQMPADTIRFLEEVLERYEFTRWRCMRPHLDRAAFRDMPHQVRLYTLDVLILKGADDWEIHNFYRGCSDYNRAVTQRQIDAQRRAVAAGLKPPRCETLRRELGWSEEGCRGCPRRRASPARPLELTLGDYTIRVKGELALIYKGDEPRYPIKIRKLESPSARKSLAKSLDVDVELVHPVAAKLLAEQLTAPEAPPKEAAVTEREEEEAEKKALRILETEDPIEFIADTVQKVHIGDREEAKILWLGTITPGLGFELNYIIVGVTGIGKSDVVYVVLCCVQDENVIRLKECSPKAIYYAVRAGVELDGAVIYFDDVPDAPDQVKTLKDLASVNRANPRLWSVTKDREFLDVDLVGSFAIMASAVTSLTDEGGQITRRYIVLNPSENPEANRAVLEHIKAMMRAGRGKRYLPPQFAVAKAVTRLIQEAPTRILIPFDFDYPDYGTEARTELKQFGALIWAVARARFKQRIQVAGCLLAEPEDFITARSLWETRQSLKLDRTASRILEKLPDAEPELREDEEGASEVLYPPSVTSTTLAKDLKEKPKEVQRKLRHLYERGYADRKAIGGRGNPYAYWKSPSYLDIQGMSKSFSSIELEEADLSPDDLGAFLRHSIGDEIGVDDAHVAAYLERYREQVQILCLGFSPKSSGQKAGSPERKGLNDLDIQETSESFASVPETPEAVKPRVTREEAPKNSSEKRAVIPADLMPLAQHVYEVLTDAGGDMGYLVFEDELSRRYGYHVKDIQTLIQPLIDRGFIIRTEMTIKLGPKWEVKK